MPLPLDPAQVRALLLDIEGTITPVEFVYKVLFPYARAQMREFLAERHAELAADIALLREEHAQDVREKLNPPTLQEDSVESLVAYLGWLMDRDRKSTGLKALQGKIWEAGYRRGEFCSEVYADVPPAFARWRRQGRAVAIFSSGSVLAQKLLFTHTTVGDLTGFIRAYFDTSTGPKTETESYRRIAAALGLPPPEILFVSDALAELNAARHVGLATACCVRPGRPESPSRTHSIIQTFDEILP